MEKASKKNPSSSVPERNKKEKIQYRAQRKNQCFPLQTCQAISKFPRTNTHNELVRFLARTFAMRSFHTSQLTGIGSTASSASIRRRHIKMNLLLVLALFFITSAVNAGLAGYGVCQAGCSGIVVARYSAAGATFGTIAAPTAPPAIVACNTAFGACQAKCAAVLLAPVP